MKSFKIIFYLFLVAAIFNACGKEHSLEGGGLKVPTGMWEFNDSLKQFQGNMDTAFIRSSSGTTKELQLIGTSADGSQTFHMHLFADTFKTGTYKASLFQSSFTYTIPAKTLYQADQLIGEFTVTITSFTNNFIAGTFSGFAQDSANKIKNLTQGKFTSTIGTGSTVTSIGVLGDSSGNCKPVTLSGIYAQGIAFTSANTVQVQVVVAVAGTYSISTNTVNGVNFSKAGTFASTGVQAVILNGNGTPSNSGQQNFTISYGNSRCNFSVTFVAGIPGDYFPLTVNSNWTYSLVGGSPSDSVHTAVIGYSPAIGGNTYNTIAFYDVPPAIAFDSSYYRKPGGDYYQYVYYSNILPFDGPVSGEYIFLKDNVAAGTTWPSPTVSGTINGLPFSAFITMTLLEKAVPVTIGTVTFPDVIKVKYEYFITGDPVALETDERWFAKDVGEIHESISDGISTSNYDIGTFQVF